MVIMYRPLLLDQIFRARPRNRSDVVERKPAVCPPGTFLPRGLRTLGATAVTKHLIGRAAARPRWSGPWAVLTDDGWAGWATAGTCTAAAACDAAIAVARVRPVGYVDGYRAIGDWHAGRWFAAMIRLEKEQEWVYTSGNKTDVGLKNRTYTHTHTHTHTHTRTHARTRKK